MKNKIIVLMIILSILSISIAEVPDNEFIFKGINKDNFFTKLISNNADLTGGEAIFEIDNPFNNLDLEKSLLFDWIIADGVNYTSHNFYVGETFNITEYKLTYETVEYTCNELDNYTNDIINKTCYKQIQNGTTEVSHMETIWSERKSISKGKYLIKFKANWKAHTGAQNTDWYPNAKFEMAELKLPDNIFFKKLEWAWFNSTWDYKKQISNLTGNFSYLEIDKESNMQPNFGDVRFTNPSDDSELNYTIEAQLDGSGLAYNSSLSPYDSGLLAGYKLDNNNFSDVTGSHSILTNYGTINATGKLLSSREFDGVNDYVDLGDMETYLDENNGTVAFWMYADDTHATEGFPFEHYSASSDRLYFSYLNDRILFAFMNNPASVQKTNLGATQWHHIVGSWQSDGTYKLYVDGNLASASSSPATIVSFTSNNGFNLGRSWQTNNRWFDGKVDEVMVFNKTFSNNDVANLYNATRAQFRVNNLGLDTIDMYYGNADVSTTESASDTYFEPISAYYLDANANDFVGSNDGTVSGATLTSGYINNSYDFDGTDDYITITDSNSLSPTDALTVSSWVYIDALPSVETYIVTKDDASNREYAIALKSTGVIECNIGGTTFPNVDTLSTGQWYHLTMTTDETTFRFYVDSDNVYNSTTAHSLISSTPDVIIGQRDDFVSGRYFNGKIDEVLIYDKALTSDQIQALYNQTAPTYVLGSEETEGADNPPNITLNAPVDNYNSSIGSITFNATVFDDINLVNVSLYIDGVLNETNSSGTNNSDYIFTKSLADCNHNWSIRACDNASQCTDSSTRYLTVDLYNPNITMIYPLNTSYTSKPTTINFTLVESHQDTCWYATNNSVNVTTNCSENITGLLASEGINTWKIWANDTFGKEDIDNVTFYVDSISPSIILISPENNILSNSLNKTFIANATDNLNLINATIYIWNSTEYNIHNETKYISGTTNQTSFDFNFTNDGGYKWNIYVCDSLNNCAFNESNFTISIDTISPNLSINSPLNQTYTTNITIFNITVIDDNIDTCLLSLDGGSNITLENISTQYNYTNSSMTEGQHSALFYCNDTHGNYNESSVSFFIDTIDPNVTILFPVNGTSYSTIQTQLNYSINDTNAQYCWYSIDYGATNSSAVSAGTNFTLNSTEGQNNWTVYCNDTVGREGNDSVIFFIDTTPFIGFVSPTPDNNSYLSSSYLPINISLTETYFDNLTIYYYLDDVLNYSITFENSTRFYNKSLSDGNWKVNATTWTTTNKSNSTETREYVIDTVSPLLTIISPENTTYYNTEISFEVQGNENLSSCLYSLDSFSTNTSMTQYNSTDYRKTVSGLTAGSYRADFWCNDTTGNSNTSSVYFYVDTFVTNLLSPDDEYVTENLYNEFNISSISVGSQVKNITLYRIVDNELIIADNIAFDTDEYALFITADYLNVSEYTTAYTYVETLTNNTWKILSNSTGYDTKRAKLYELLYYDGRILSPYTENVTRITSTNSSEYLQGYKTVAIACYDRTGATKNWAYRTNVLLPNQTKSLIWDYYTLQQGGSEPNADYIVNSPVNFSASATAPISETIFSKINWDGSVDNIGTDTFYNLSDYSSDNLSTYVNADAGIGQLKYSWSRLLIMSDGNANITFDAFLQTGTQCGSTTLTNYTEEGIPFINENKVYYNNYTFNVSIYNTYEWTAESCNVNGTCEFANENRTIYLDVFSPAITINYPTNTSYITNVSTANFTATDNYIDSCWYSNGTTNFTAISAVNGSNYLNITSNLLQNQIIVYCNDTRGNIGSKSIYYYLDAIRYASNSDTTNTSTTGIGDVFINVTLNPILEFKNISFNGYNLTNITITNYIVDNYSVETTNSTLTSTTNPFYWDVILYDTNNNSYTLSKRYKGVEIINLSLNGTSGNIYVELGTPINISATSNIYNVSIDINHPDYGTNYTSGFLSTSENLIINYFRNTLFSDGEEYNNNTYDLINETTNVSQFDIKNVTIPEHQYDYVNNISFNISGNINNGNSTDESLILIYSTNNYSEYDKLFYGELINDYMYLNKITSRTTLGVDFNESSYVSYNNMGTQFLYFPLTSGIEIVSIILNIAGIEYGFSFANSNFDGYKDEILTNATVFQNLIYPASVGSILTFDFDNFSNNSIWGRDKDDNVLNPNDDFEKVTTETLSNGSMYFLIELDEDIDIADKSASETANYYIRINDTTSILNSLAVENITISGNISYSYQEFYGEGNEYDACEISDTYSYVKFGGATLWEAFNLPDEVTGGYNCFEDDGNCDGSYSYSNMRFVISKNESAGYYTIYKYGTEVWDAEYNSGATDCDIIYTKNWTAGTYTYDYDDCGSGSGNLSNALYITNIDETSMPVEVRARTRAEGDTNGGATFYGCDHVYYDANIDDVTIGLSQHSDSIYYSTSVFDSASIIPSLTYIPYVGGTTGNNFTFQVSTNNGDNYQDAIYDGNTTNIIYTGEHVKHKVGFYPASGYTTILPFMNYVSISTETGNPTNVSLDFGNDGTYDYTSIGEIDYSNGTITVNLTSANVDDIFSGSSDGLGDVYLVPVKIYSATRGIVNVTSVNITYNPNPIYLDISSFNNSLSNINGSGNINISIGAINGTINVSDLRYDYAGGNKTYEILAHNLDYSINKTYDITYYFSQWDYEFIPSVDYILFMPRYPTAKNVSAYGQTEILPLLNITNIGYGGRNANLSVYLNDTLSCVNTTISLTGDKEDGIIINNSWTNLANMDYLESVNISLWADFNCNYSTWRLYNPYFIFRTCTENTICDEGVI